MSKHSLDNCPRCGRRITDYDVRGREADNGQRDCNGPCPGDDWADVVPTHQRAE
jgi:hypothetical protein